jgi:hypothetical protein
LSDAQRSGFVRWAEFFGLAGVIASLLFVGLELRQSTAVARAEAYRAYVSDINQTNLLAVDPIYGGALSRRYLEGVPYEELSDLERTAWLGVTSAQLWIYQSIFLQVQAGVLDESAFSMVDQLISDDPAWHFTWRVQGGAMSPDFRLFLRERYPFLD